MIRLAKSPIQVLIPNGSTIDEAKEIKQSIMETKEGKSNRFYNAALTSKQILDNALDGYIITAGYDYKGNSFRNNENVGAFASIIIDIDDKQNYCYEDFKKSELFQYTAVTYPSTSNTVDQKNFRVIIKLPVEIKISDNFSRDSMIELYRTLVKLVTDKFGIEYDKSSQKIAQQMYGTRCDSGYLFPDMCYTNDDAVLPKELVAEAFEILAKEEAESKDREEQRKLAVIEYNKTKKSKSYKNLEEKLQGIFFTNLVEWHLEGHRFEEGKHNASLNFATLALQDGHNEAEVWQAINLAIPTNGIHDADYYIREGRKRATKFGYNIPTKWQLKAKEYSEVNKTKTELPAPVKRLSERTDVKESAYILSTELGYRNNFKILTQSSYNSEAMKFFGGLTDEAIEWCKSNSISELIYSNWFYSTGGKWENRLIIPFYDSENKMYHFTTRSITGEGYKYMSPFSNIIPLYNIFNVDINSPVIFVRSIIDSLFIENSVAISNNDFTSLDYLGVDRSNMWFIFDNTDKGKKEALVLMEMGYNVFLWKKFINKKRLKNEKDISKIVVANNLSHLRADDVKEFFSNNIMLKAMI
jgi:hypothetical protein